MKNTNSFETKPKNSRKASIAAIAAVSVALVGAAAFTVPANAAGQPGFSLSSAEHKDMYGVPYTHVVFKALGKTVWDVDLTSTQGVHQIAKKLAKTGAPGKTGATGKTGAAGKDGADGTNGTNGTNGADGAKGASGLEGAYYAVAKYDLGDTNGGAVATVACKLPTDVAISGGVQTLALGDNGLTNNVPVSSSFPGRMDWSTNTPKPGNLSGWIVQFGTETGAAPKYVNIWALCVPGQSIAAETTYTESGN